MVGFIVQYQSPFTFTDQAVFYSGFRIDISSVDVLDTDVASLNGIGGIDNAGISNYGVGRKKVFKPLNQLRWY
jgi:hypothetical protein